jgi:hypothetical protein
MMKSVFVLHHWRDDEDDETNMFIGVYVTRADAEAAIARLRQQPGFCDWPKDFDVGEYELNKDHWAEGFVALINILVPYTKKEGDYCVALSVWRPGDRYRISSFDDDVDTASLAFGVGDHVRCETRVTEAHGEAMVAVELVEDGD